MTRLTACAILFVLSVVLAFGKDEYSKDNGLYLLDVMGQLVRYSFETGEVKEIFKAEHSSFDLRPRNLEMIGEKAFLFDSPGIGIFISTLDDGRTRTLIDDAQCATYFESTGELLYTKLEKIEGGYVGKTMVTDIDTSQSQLELFEMEHGTETYCPIKLNETQALLFRSVLGNPGMAIYTTGLRNKITEEFSISCVPIAAINEAEMLCRDGRKIELGQVGTSPKPFLKLSKAMRPIGILSGGETAILHESYDFRLTGSLSSVTEHEVSSGENRVILERFRPAAGGLEVIAQNKW